MSNNDIYDISTNNVRIRIMLNVVLIKNNDDYHNKH